MKALIKREGFWIFKKTARKIIYTSSDEENIHTIMTEVVHEHSLKLGQLAQPVRIILTGGTVSPPIDQTIRLLGKERVVARLENAIKEKNQCL